jgi:hypothetical protein
MKNLKKTFFVVAIFTIIHPPLFGQNVTGYLKALKYITNENAGKRIIVCDTIIHLPFHNFTEQISELWHKNSSIVNHILDSIDHAQGQEKFILPEFKNLRFAGKKPTEIIYFSNFYSFMVIGEVIEQENGKRGLGHDVNTGFNESTQYLFIFDEKYSLKKVFKVRVAYD